MCIAGFIWQAHPLYPLVLVFNRDEYFDRPTKPLEWWEGGGILGGRDGLAGGTWLASTKHGKVAFITNFREVLPRPTAKSRGDLPVRFLKSMKSPMEFAHIVVKEADQYNGFNLILVDICSKSMAYVTNRAEEGSNFATEVQPGLHVLANAQLDSPWPKALRLNNNFKEYLNKNGNQELSSEELVEKLMKNTIKDEENMLPGIYSPLKEYQLSSIFVDSESPLGRYGTRSMSSLTVKKSGEATFFERHLEDKVWIDKSFTYKIENML